MKIKSKGSPRSITMQIITRHVETSELGQQVLIHCQTNTSLWERTGLGNFSPSYHYSLLDIISLSDRAFIFLHEMQKTENEERTETCFSSCTTDNLFLQVGMATIQRQPISAQTTDGSQANFLLHISQMKSKIPFELVQQPQNHDHKRLFRCHSKK